MKRERREGEWEKWKDCGRRRGREREREKWRGVGMRETGEERIQWRKDSEGAGVERGRGEVGE